MGSYVQFAHSPDILCLSSLLAVAAPLSSYATASAHTVRCQQADEQELDGGGGTCTTFYCHHHHVPPSTPIYSLPPSHTCGCDGGYNPPPDMG